MNNKVLTEKEAYLAMHAFLEKYYEMTKSDEIAGLLGSMSILKDGNSVDPAYMKDWKEAVDKVVSTKHDAHLRLQK